jgi:hypothetical protein
MPIWLKLLVGMFQNYVLNISDSSGIEIFSCRANTQAEVMHFY